MSTSTSDFRERAGQRSTEARDYDSTPSLLRRLVNDVGMLFTQEAALLKAEMGRSIGEMKAATISLAIGGAVLFLGLIFLLLAAVYALSNVLDPWLAALIVGGVVTVVGAIMLATGRSKLQPTAIAPRRTADALRKDTQMVKGVSQHEHR
jgi:Putative Actinobacterial Holin-X, holin superfamily III